MSKSMFEKSKDYLKDSAKSHNIPSIDKWFAYVDLLTESLFCKIVKGEYSCDNIKAALVLKPLVDTPQELANIEKLFNKDIAGILYKVKFDEGNISEFSKIKDEKVSSSFFIIYRIILAQVAMEAGDKKIFNDAVIIHDKLRRYVNSSKVKENFKLIDYEQEVIKCGRNQLSGKPSSNHTYKHLMFA